MQVKLVVVSESQSGREIPIAGEKFLIGRGEECQLRPASSLVSRKHCLISVAQGQVAIEDCGSRNGTFVNDEKISARRVLNNGDRIRVGVLAFDLHISIPAGLETPKRPAVTSVEEAVRTVAKTVAAKDDVDIIGWFGEEPEEPAFSSQSTLALGGDTMVGKGMSDTASLQNGLKPANAPKPAPAKQDLSKSAIGHDASKSAIGKTPPKPAKPKPLRPKTDSSGEAADAALRQFFHRKKT